MSKRSFLVCAVAAWVLLACSQVSPAPLTGEQPLAEEPAPATQVVPVPREIAFEHVSQIPVGEHPTSISSGDFDLDGDPDLVVTNDGRGAGNTLSLLMNDGGGDFALSSLVEVGREPISILAADWNQDGYLDLSVANHESDDVSIMLNDGTGTFLEGARVRMSPDSYPFMMAAGDFDLDGDLDIGLANYLSTGSVSILSNRGAGQFSLTASVTIEGNPYSVAAADLDGDGDLDLAAAGHDANSASILLNTEGDFSLAATVPVGDEPWSVIAGDFDGDHDLDLAVANEGSNDLSLLLNDGAAEFTVAQTVKVGDEPYSVAAGDFDGDGDLDLAVANEDSHTLSVLTNDGQGEFSESLVIAVGEEPWFVITDDLDRDGDLDLAVANADSNSISILINSSRPR